MGTGSWRDARRFRLWLVTEQGQHSAEFALLIGITALAAIGMQPICERAMRAGVQVVSDVTLGVPEEEDLTTVELRVEAQQTVDVEGDAAFVRQTEVHDSIIGRAVNEDCQVTIPTGGGVDGSRTRC